MESRNEFIFFFMSVLEYLIDGEFVISLKKKSRPIMNLEKGSIILYNYFIVIIITL